MNRRQRRAAESSRRKDKRAESIRIAFEYLAVTDAADVVGGTLFLPSGETLYLDAAAARTMADRSGAEPKQ